MKGMIKGHIIGNLGHDPRVRTEDSEIFKHVGSMGVACNRRVKRSGEWVDETQWVEVVVFGATVSKYIEPYIKKGCSVFAAGSFEMETYFSKKLDKDVTVLKLYARDLQLLSSPKGDSQQESQAHSYALPEKQENSSSTDLGEEPDDIPWK